MAPEKNQPKSDIVGVQLALEAYQKYARLKDIPGSSTQAHFEYSQIRDSLSPDDRSRLDDQILELERPDLATAPEPRPPSAKITGEEVAELLRDTLKNPEGGK